MNDDDDDDDDGDGEYNGSNVVLFTKRFRE